MNVNPMEKDELALPIIPSTDREKKATIGATTGVRIAREGPIEFKGVPKQPIDPEAEARRKSFKLEITELTRLRALEDQKRAAQREQSRQTPDMDIEQTNLSPKSSPLELNLKPRSSALEVKLVSKTTTMGQISPARSNRTIQKLPPKITSRPQGTFPPDLESLELQSMAAKPKAVSRGGIRKVAKPSHQPTTPMFTNQTTPSAPIRSSTKITQTTQSMRVVQTAAIDASPTTKSLHSVEAVSASAPVSSTFPSPLETFNPNTRQSTTLSKPDITSIPNNFTSPYSDDAVEDSDEEL